MIRTDRGIQLSVADLRALLAGVETRAAQGSEACVYLRGGYSPKILQYSDDPAIPAFNYTDALATANC